MGNPGYKREITALISILRRAISRAKRDIPSAKKLVVRAIPKTTLVLELKYLSSNCERVFLFIRW